MTNPLLIGIAGASCSGKTTIASALVRALEPNATVLGLDSYYHDLSHLSDDEIHAYNLDEPAALEDALLTEQLEKLAAGHAIDKPVYDYKTHTRVADSLRIDPCEYVIIEGLFTLHWPAVRDLLDLAVFVDVSHEVALSRRIERDRSQRGRMPETVEERYEKMVRPMADHHVIPTRVHADVVCDGTLPTDSIVKEIVTALCEKRKDR